MPKNRTDLPWERQKGESAQAFAAFLVYLNLGAERSHQTASQQCGKSISLIGRWSRAYGWVERCRAWDNYLQREAKKAAVTEIRKMNQQHIQLARALQGAAAQALKDRGAAIVTDKNIAAILKLGTDLERSCRVYEMDTLSEDLKKAEEDSAVVKIICDIPRVQPPADAPPKEGVDEHTGE